MWDRVAEYIHFYVAVGLFIAEMGWVSVAVISFLTITLSLCLIFLSWTLNLLIYAAIVGVYMYFRQNYYAMNKLPGYVEPRDGDDAQR